MTDLIVNDIACGLAGVILGVIICLLWPKPSARISPIVDQEGLNIQVSQRRRADEQEKRLGEFAIRDTAKVSKLRKKR